MCENNRAAIYCRLSKDDEQCGDSVSIETQRMMLTKYCADNNFTIYDIYIDDGYSGLNFERPSFKRLIDDLEHGKFDVVITKDLSRLGRDYIQTGYYIDIYFVSKRVRYIAVNDGIDTKLDNNDIAPFKNILNDMYAKDLSRKVKSAKQQRAQNGLYISSQPPYGYKVNPYNRSQLIIDPEAAEIVKLVFDLVEVGNNFSEVSRILERSKILTPATYKVLKGDTRFLNSTSEETKYKWSYQTVRTIVKNPVYVGDMVNHKVETVNYKTKERVCVPIEERIVVPNMHEPIIDRERFMAINQRLANLRSANHKLENIFKDIAFCSECGGKMQLIVRRTKSAEKPMFRCAEHAYRNPACVHFHFIDYDELLEEVRKQLHNHIADFIDSHGFEELCDMMAGHISSRVQEIRRARLQSELQRINKRIKEYYKDFRQHGKTEQLDTLYGMQRDVMQKITNTSRDGYTLTNADLFAMKKIIRENLLVDTLDEETLQLFVSRIEIGHVEREPSGSYKRVKLYYRF